MTKAKAKAPAVQDVRTSRTSSNRVAKSEDALMRERVEAIGPGTARRTKNTTSQSERDFIEMERDAQAARDGRTDFHSRKTERGTTEHGNSLRGENAQDRQVVQFEVPAGSVDINQLADLLARRLAPGQMIVGTGFGGGGGSPGGIHSAGFGGGSNHNSDQSKCLDASTSAYATEAKPLRPANPVELEVTRLDAQIGLLHTIIGELSGALEPVLAYEQVEDSADEAEVTKRTMSESPHHNRLLDMNQYLGTAINRLRYLQSRVRN